MHAQRRIGYSKVIANNSGYEADYIHIGAGFSEGALPLSLLASVGIVNNSYT